MNRKKFETIILETQHGVKTLTLNRPEPHNAFNDVMIAEISEAVSALAQDGETRAVLIKGSGKSFCAGADLNWMKRMALASSKENIADAKRLHDMLLLIHDCPKPVLAQIHGAVMGGGTGLVAAVDMAYAEQETKFAFSEVKLGLIPAVISPFVLSKISTSAAREYFLTGERFTALQAKQIGLIQGMGSAGEIEDLIDQKIKHLKQAAPGAVAASKKLIEEVLALSLNQAREVSAKRIAERRASQEGQEGMKAFLEKRKPIWAK